MTAVASARERATLLIAEPRRRRVVYAIVAIVLALLCVFPQPYVARAKLVPQDSNTGLGSLISSGAGQLQGFAALLGGARTPIDYYLAIGRSPIVTNTVIKRLALAGADKRYATVHAARIKLARDVDIHSLPGGILEIETKTFDPEYSQALTAAFADAVSDRIRMLGRDQVNRKRDLVRQRFGEAEDRLVRAETALNAFRRRNNLAEPEAQLGTEIALRAGLQGQLQAKIVALQTLQRFQGPENAQLQATRSEVASLRAQIAGTTSPARGVGGPNVAGLSELSNEYLNLYRDYRFAQALYEVYSRTSEEVAVETLASESAADVQVVEAPNLDPERHYNVRATALLALLLMLILFTEIYAPATGVVLFRPHDAASA